MILLSCAGEADVAGSSALLVNTAVALISLVVGWFLKLFSDRLSDTRLYDHRLRLEKEYGLYGEMWDKLFELRRALGWLVDTARNPAEACNDSQRDAFNTYQEVVRKGEPFMSRSVYDPARKIATIGRRMIANVEEQRSLAERRAKAPNPEAPSQWLSNKMDDLANENESAFKEVDDLFGQVAAGTSLQGLRIGDYQDVSRDRDVRRAIPYAGQAV